MAVHEAWQHRGVGRRLVQAAVELAAAGRPPRWSVATAAADARATCASTSGRASACGRWSGTPSRPTPATRPGSRSTASSCVTGCGSTAAQRVTEAPAPGPGAPTRPSPAGSTDPVPPVVAGRASAVAARGRAPLAARVVLDEVQDAARRVAGPQRPGGRAGQQVDRLHGEQRQRSRDRGPARLRCPGAAPPRAPGGAGPPVPVRPPRSPRGRRARGRARPRRPAGGRPR